MSWDVITIWEAVRQNGTDRFNVRRELMSGVGFGRQAHPTPQLYSISISGRNLSPRIIIKL
jgi:hypothetical protein